jgi:hypothetical protein
MTQMYLADDESEPFIYLMESVSLSACPLMYTDVSPEQYLQFAAEDLEAESKHSAINALGNVKRALHETVDSLLQGYGLLALNRRLSFPRKLELIDAAGLFSLSILNTLNEERNLMEHDYRVPTHARAQEALDVVRLWLLATRRLSEFIVYESLADSRTDQTLGVVQLNPALGLLSFYKVNGPSRQDEFEGRQYTFLLQIRTPRGGLAEGVEIDPEPVWSVELRYRNRADWQPLLRPIVALNGYRYGVDGAVVTTSGVRISMRLNLAPPAQEQLQEWMQNRRRASPTLDYGKFAFGFKPDTSVEPASHQ